MNMVGVKKGLISYPSKDTILASILLEPVS